jgi:3-methyl-2-oxobutanoate hydroxymethyltransferase
MAGLTPSVAKFAKRYADAAGLLKTAAQAFADEVVGGVYPSAEYSYR